MMTQKTIEKLLEQVKPIVNQAAVFIRKERQTFDNKSIVYKGTNDMVSYVDQTAESILVDALAKLDDGIGFIAEEGSGGSQKELNWIIDPLDGTTNFIHNVPMFAVSVALARGKDLLLSVVHEVSRDDVFVAGKGLGAYRNGDRIAVSKNTTFDQSLIATGLPFYDFSLWDEYRSILETLMPVTHGIRRIGAASVDLAYTACGIFDAFFEYNLKPWDVAGGALIVKEAGGLVTDWSGGDDYVFDGKLVCGNPDLHRLVLNTIQKHYQKS